MVLPHLKFACGLAAALWSLLAPALAQAALAQGIEPVVDPYSEGDLALLKKIGIEALAPFPWADDHSTADIERELSEGNRIRWVETRHFKIGVGLKDRPLPADKTERQDLLAEIGKLALHLPKLKRRPKALDSWLLAHLYAVRLEALYADFAGRIGWTAAAPPTPLKGSDGRQWRQRGGLGSGPYLGQHGKFCLLIVEQRGDVERYLRRWTGRNVEEPTAHHFLESNSLVYVTTPDTRWDALKTERGLHCNVVYATVRNFVSGFKGFTYELPVWVSEGLGHWYRRRLDEDYNSFAALAQNQIELVQGSEWRSKTRARVESDIWVRAADLLLWRAQDISEFQKHVMMWSRIDYLLTLGDEPFAKFLTELKGLPTTGVPFEQVCEQQVAALQKAYGLDLAVFDERWCQWVRKTYPKK